MTAALIPLSAAGLRVTSSWHEIKRLTSRDLQRIVIVYPCTLVLAQVIAYHPGDGWEGIGPEDHLEGFVKIALRGVPQIIGDILPGGAGVTAWRRDAVEEVKLTVRLDVGRPDILPPVCR